MAENYDYEKMMAELDLDAQAVDAVFATYQTLAKDRYTVSDEGGSVLFTRIDERDGVIVNVDVSPRRMNKISALLSAPLVYEENQPISCSDISRTVLALENKYNSLQTKGYVGSYRRYDDGVEFEFALSAQTDADLEKILDDFDMTK